MTDALAPGTPRRTVLELASEHQAMSDAELGEHARDSGLRVTRRSGVRSITFQLAQLGLLCAQTHTQPRRYRRTPAGTQALRFTRPALSRQMSRALLSLDTQGQNLRQLQAALRLQDKAQVAGLLRGLRFLDRAGLCEAAGGYRLTPDGQTALDQARHVLAATFPHAKLKRLAQLAGTADLERDYRQALALGSVSGDSERALACTDFSFWLTQWLLAARAREVRQGNVCPSEAAWPALSALEALLDARQARCLP